MEDKKMRTITYNTEREVITAILILIFSFMVLTVGKAQGLRDLSVESTLKADQNHGKAIRTTDIGSENAENDHSLEVRIKTWMYEGSFWDNTAEEKPIASKLAQTISNWMSNGSFWSATDKNETEDESVAVSGKHESPRDALSMDTK